MATNVGPQWEPSAEQVEALAKELCEAHCEGTIYGVQWPNLNGLDARDGYRAEARFILRRHRERESGLLEALRRIEGGVGPAYPSAIAAGALAAHAKLDAPKEPTLLEAARAFTVTAVNMSDYIPALAKLKMAIERAEKGT